MGTAQDAPGALHGIKILSFAHVGQGPAAIQLLADMGADVIKVERPGVGAWERSWAGMGAFVEGESLFFLGFNRNQRSLTVNLKDEQGKEIVYRLVRWADVVVENYRPGVMDRLGLGYERLAELNPGVIYCSATGFGREGPYRDRPGQDLVLQSESGLASMTGRKHDPPIATGVPVVDMHAAALMALGVVSALLYRERTGVGQRVETSLLAAALHLQLEPLVYFLNGRWLRDRSQAGIASTYHGAPYGIYQTKDGYLALSLNPLTRLGLILGVPELLTLSDEDADQRPDAIRRLIEPVLMTKTTAEWLAVLLKEDIWCGAVNTYDDLEDHPQLRAIEAFQTIVHPKAGTVRVPRNPLRFSKTPPGIWRHPPMLGEHTVAILAELGYSERAIQTLREEGIV